MSGLFGGKSGVGRLTADPMRGLLGLAVVVLLAVGVGAVATRSATDLPGEESATEPAGETAGETAVTGSTPESRGAGALGPPSGAGAAGKSGASAPDAPAATVREGSAGGAGAAASGSRETAWASPREPSPVEPVAPELRVPKPAAVRGIYAGAWTVGSDRGFQRLLELADETEVNAFVIDIKDATGETSYASRVPLARQVGATERLKIRDVRERLERLREHGIYPIARIVVFKDPLLAKARPEWSIKREDGTLWADDHGVHWVDSFNRSVWDYNIELAREAIALGFGEIQWDYIRFPDVPRSYLLEAIHPAQEGRAKTDGVREFMLYARERMADLGVPLTADVFGITTSTHRDIGIGQVWEKMSDAVDVLLPMVYPSHYPRGSWEYENPNAAPYQIVKRAMDDGVKRSLLIDNAAEIRPWLQAFSMGQPAYGAREIRAQIDAVYDAGLTEWILWSPSVRYPREAFASAAGEEPWFAGMGEALYTPAAPAARDSTGAAAEPLGRKMEAGQGSGGGR